MEATEKYRQTNVERNQDNIKYAYIVFRSMEGMARAVNAYQLNSFERLWLDLTCRRGKYKSRNFLDRYLDVKQAVDPSLILWENLGSSIWHRAQRVVVITFVSFLLLCITLMINVYTQYKERELKAYNPQIQCDPTISIDPSAALVDYDKGANQVGLMYCLCKGA